MSYLSIYLSVSIYIYVSIYLYLHLFLYLCIICTHFVNPSPGCRLSGAVCARRTHLP